MPSAVGHHGKWRIKPSSQLPVFLRFIINSSFIPEYAKKYRFKHFLGRRMYLNHMMYWPAEEYNRFESEVIKHLKTNDGWFEWYAAKNLKDSERLYRLGLKFKKTDWSKKNNAHIRTTLLSLLEKYRELCCGWYAQYSLDEYFESAIEGELKKSLPENHPDFRKLVLVFTDPHDMTEVAEERLKLVKLAKQFLDSNENLARLSKRAERRIEKHLDKFAYINRGLATSHPYTLADIVGRIGEIKKLIQKGESMATLLYNASDKKIKNDFKLALTAIKPNRTFLRIIRQARHHSYLRNRRVEAFFNADYGASFMYKEIARRAEFNPEWIMQVSVSEMLGALSGGPLPPDAEIKRRLANYAMLVENGKTKLITDAAGIGKLERQYSVAAEQVSEIKGRMACLGGIIKGRAKICLDKNEIGKVKTGDILVTLFTTPDFVPAMERAATIVAEQGGLSSHAAIVSRELGVPCVIAAKNATRVIHDNDLLEIDAQTGVIKILESWQNG